MPKILVYDDMPEILKVVEYYLHDLGIYCTTVITAADVLKHAKEHDILLLDSTVPNQLDLDSLIDQLRDIANAYIVVFTGHTGMLFPKADYVMYKPFTSYALFRLVEVWRERSSYAE
jgi:DNA-binding response OmpR family regulator